MLELLAALRLRRKVVPEDGTCGNEQEKEWQESTEGPWNDPNAAFLRDLIFPAVGAAFSGVPDGLRMFPLSAASWDNNASKSCSVRSLTLALSCMRWATLATPPSTGLTNQRAELQITDPGWGFSKPFKPKAEFNGFVFCKVEERITKCCWVLTAKRLHDDCGVYSSWSRSLREPERRSSMINLVLNQVHNKCCISGKLTDFGTGTTFVLMVLASLWLC